MRVFLALALIAAAPATPKAVIDAVKAKLTDPDSAKFRDIRKIGDKSYCGWVNAKNSYGGYIGDQLFYDDAGFVQILDQDAVFDASDLALQTHLFATGETDRAAAMKPRLSEYGKKVEPCLKDVLV